MHARPAASQSAARRAPTGRSSAGSGGDSSGAGALGGEAFTAGLEASLPQFTAWVSARRRTPWIRRAVAGANPRSLRSHAWNRSTSAARSRARRMRPNFGTRQRSMIPRVSSAVFGEHQGSACANHSLQQHPHGLGRRDQLPLRRRRPVAASSRCPRVAISSRTVPGAGDATALPVPPLNRHFGDAGQDRRDSARATSIAATVPGTAPQPR